MRRVIAYVRYQWQLVQIWWALRKVLKAADAWIKAIEQQNK